MSPRRRLAFGFLTALLVVLGVEVSSLLLLSVERGEWTAWRALRHARQRVIADQDAALLDREILREAPQGMGKEVIHPYLGFVLDSRFHRRLRHTTGGQEALDFGLVLSQPGLFAPRVDDRRAIAITGGSLAFNLAEAAAGELRQDFLGALPGYEDARVFNLALPGYKQPQQLILLNYLLALGARLDLVVNVDGFNEVALPPSENLPFGVYPFFPRNWYFRAQDLDPELRKSVGELAYRHGRRRVLARRFDAAPWRWSLTASLLWTVFDRRAAAGVDELERSVRALRAGADATFTVTGPGWDRDREATYRALAVFWRRASEQLDALVARRGGRYYHFLQPNQYLAGSKPMTEEEQRIAIVPDHGYGVHAAAAYPLLIEEGRELTRRGVRYTDLTALFATVEEPVYRDACCHLNPFGQTLLARRVADVLRADLAASPTAAEPAP